MFCVRDIDVRFNIIVIEMKIRELNSNKFELITPFKCVFPCQKSSVADRYVSLVETSGKNCQKLN